MKKVTVFVTLLAIGLVSALAAYAGKPGEIKFEEYHLDNGLRVILSEDKSVQLPEGNGIQPMCPANTLCYARNSNLRSE